ncbi:MAG: zf-HC2 domain-containing protein [Gemmatimonadota bacterium]|nr:zf-HC2 domain-containing protein [Gemmatimonadota bacterium]MDH5758132.1 zf-HC2 domain-containing protein [Gemmatimonadota bacterium]
MLKHKPGPGHLGAEQFQALVDGEIALSERERCEAHLASCEECATELGSWRVLFAGLDELPMMAPSAEFSARVMAGVRPARAPSLAARVQAVIRGLLPAPAQGTGGPSGHIDPGTLQDFVEGLLPARGLARVQTHLDACGACGAEAAEWRNLLVRLEDLDTLSPSSDFAETVMKRVKVPVPRHSVSVATVRRPTLGARALAWAGSVLPDRRTAWAAASGVAFTPAVIVGLLVTTLATHPTLTAGSLASFLWWQLTDLAVGAWQGLAGGAVQSAPVFRLYASLETLTGTPGALAASVALFSLAVVSASWVLYKNLFTHPRVDGRYARVSN